MTRPALSLAAVPAAARGRVFSLAALVVLAVTAGCETTLGLRKDQLEDAQERWRASGPSSYRYDLRYGCFCGGEITRQVTVSVVNGVTASVVYSDSGTAADTTHLVGLLTVEQLFAHVLEEINDRPDELTAQYDATLGYLTQVYVDPDKNAADEEHSVTVTGFQSQP